MGVGPSERGYCCGGSVATLVDVVDPCTALHVPHDAIRCPGCCSDGQIDALCGSCKAPNSQPCRKKNCGTSDLANEFFGLPVAVSSTAREQLVHEELVGQTYDLTGQSLVPPLPSIERRKSKEKHSICSGSHMLLTWQNTPPSKYGPVDIDLEAADHLGWLLPIPGSPKPRIQQETQVAQTCVPSPVVLGSAGELLLIEKVQRSTEATDVPVKSELPLPKERTKSQSTVEASPKSQSIAEASPKQSSSPIAAEAPVVEKTLSSISATSKRSLSERFIGEQGSAVCNYFFFFEPGAFLLLDAPNGQTWEQYCTPAQPTFSTGISTVTVTLTGPWAECIHAAAVFENSNPDFAKQREYVSISPTQQVIDFFEACGHSEQTPALEEAKKATQRQLASCEEASGISSSRCTSRSPSRMSEMSRDSFCAS